MTITRAGISSPAIDMATTDRQTSRLQGLLLPAITAVIALLVYGSTMAPDLTWAHYGSDGGELITASISSGIPHPPGYPVYTVLGKIAALVPIGVTAWRFNLFSAVAGATAVAFVTATAFNTLAGTKHQEIVSVATGLSAAFAPLVWGQALTTEVYALNLAFLSLFLWSLLCGHSEHLSGLFLGLAVTTHLSSLIMLPLALILTPRQLWKGLLLGIVVGLIPFLLLPILARSGSPVIWGDPTTLSGWWWLVTGQLYHANIRLPETGVILSRTLYFGSTLLRQMAWAGWLFIVLGIAARLVVKRVAISLLATALLYLIYGYLYQTDDVIVNLLPVIIILSPLLAVGLSRIGAWSLLLPLALLLLNYQTLNLHNDRSVRPLAENILRSAPENALLLTAGDHSIFSLWYFHHVEEMRSDISLVDANLLAFDWYRERLKGQYPDMVFLERDDLEEFRARNGRLRPLCHVLPNLGGIANCTSDFPNQAAHNSGG